MWEANACQLPDDCHKIANAVSKGLTIEQFDSAWNEIQFPGFELFKKTKCGKFIYSKRLLEQMQRIEEISKKRKEAGRSGGKSKGKQVLSNCDEDDLEFA